MSPVNNQGQETKEIRIQTWFKARLNLRKDIQHLLHLTCACANCMFNGYPVNVCAVIS